MPFAWLHVQMIHHHQAPDRAYSTLTAFSAGVSPFSPQLSLSFLGVYERLPLDNSVLCIDSFG